MNYEYPRSSYLNGISIPREWITPLRIGRRGRPGKQIGSERGWLEDESVVLRAPMSSNPLAVKETTTKCVQY